jgi:hypothetical protein
MAPEVTRQSILTELQGLEELLQKNLSGMNIGQ